MATQPQAGVKLARAGYEYFLGHASMSIMEGGSLLFLQSHAVISPRRESLQRYCQQVKGPCTEMFFTFVAHIPARRGEHTAGSWSGKS